MMVGYDAFNELTNKKVGKNINYSVSQLYRNKMEIQSFRTALDWAEKPKSSFPKYYELQRIYQEIELDSEVSNLQDIRTNYILSRDIIVENEKGEENE